MSIAGNIRCSASARSSMISLLPVPLNSSKMSWSIREPVLMRHVAMMVTEPPFSIVRASPKSFLGICIAPAESPPLMVALLLFCPGCPALLKALPILVRLSISSTTSLPHSSSVWIWDSNSWASSTCSLADWSEVLAMTSALVAVLLNCVTSSGLSSMSSTMTRVSGEHWCIAVAICSSSTVFPAFGGETIICLEPFPIGAMRSIILMLVFPPVLRSNLWWGSIATRSEYRGLFANSFGSMPASVSIDISFVWPFFRSSLPVTAAPSQSLYWCANWGGTAISDCGLRYERSGVLTTKWPRPMCFSIPVMVSAIKVPYAIFL